MFKTIIYLKKTGSTMTVAKHLLSMLEPPFIVIAESQIFGHGQRNRKWLSQEGGLWFTEVFYTERILGLSLFISIPILRVLKKYNQEIKVKWPNDLYLNDKKIAGILTKTSRNIAFVGIGINVENDIPDKAKKYAISLKKQKHYSRKGVRSHKLRGTHYRNDEWNRKNCSRNCAKFLNVCVIST